MKKLAYLLIALVFLSGCALTTIRAPKRKAPEPKPAPVKKTVVEKVKEVLTPKPEPAVEEKEEVLPLVEEEEIK